MPNSIFYVEGLPDGSGNPFATWVLKQGAKDWSKQPELLLKMEMEAQCPHLK